MFVFSVAIVTEKTNIYLILMSDECIYLRDTRPTEHDHDSTGAYANSTAFLVWSPSVHAMPEVHTIRRSAGSGLSAGVGPLAGSGRRA